MRNCPSSPGAANVEIAGRGKRERNQTKHLKIWAWVASLLHWSVYVSISVYSVLVKYIFTFRLKNISSNSHQVEGILNKKENLDKEKFATEHYRPFTEGIIRTFPVLLGRGLLKFPSLKLGPGCEKTPNTKSARLATWGQDHHSD